MTTTFFSRAEFYLKASLLDKAVDYSQFLVVSWVSILGNRRTNFARELSFSSSARGKEGRSLMDCVLLVDGSVCR